MSTTLTVRMDDELLDRLRQTAKRDGKSLNQVINEGARMRCADSLRGMRVAEAIAPYVGVVDSGGRYDASRASEEFGEALEERAREPWQ